MKKVFLTLTSLLLFMVAVPLVLAAVWISEDIHEHTGYSTLVGV